MHRYLLERLHLVWYWLKDQRVGQSLTPALAACSTLVFKLCFECRYKACPYESDPSYLDLLDSRCHRGRMPQGCRADDPQPHALGSWQPPGQFLVQPRRRWDGRGRGAVNLGFDGTHQGFRRAELPPADDSAVAPGQGFRQGTCSSSLCDERGSAIPSRLDIHLIRSAAAAPAACFRSRLLSRDSPSGLCKLFRKFFRL